MAGGHVARDGELAHSALGPMVIGLGLGLLAALAGAPDAAAGLLYSSSYFAELNVLAYSRVQESEADQAAITYLEKAGYSSAGLVDFFNNFRYQEVFDDEKKYPYFRDHPLTDDRIEALTVRAKASPLRGEGHARHRRLRDRMKAKIKDASPIARSRPSSTSPRATPRSRPATPAPSPTTASWRPRRR